jgi:hypothetical protein
MEDGIGIFCAPLQKLDGFVRGTDDQFNFASLCLTSSRYRPQALA